MFLAVMLATPPPDSLRIGRVTAVYWPGEERAAHALAEQANRSSHWPGIGEVPGTPIRVLLAASRDRFDSLVGAPMPPFVGGVARPEAHTIILKTTGDPAGTLRHELAHLALHSAVSEVPLWFDEGYAAWASGEWDRLDALAVNWALVRGATPSLDDVNSTLRANGAMRSSTAYALAETAVAFLARVGGDRGLEPIITALRRRPDFETALREAHAVTLDRFEELWQRDLRHRYGWLSFLTSAGIFWGVLAILLIIAWSWRRRRDRARRLGLDDGWEIPPDDMPPTS